MRRATAAAVAALALLVWFAAPASAGDPVKDRQAAQARANAAAAKLARATTELAKVERDLATLQAKTDAAKDRLSTLETQVKQVAVNSYVRGNLGDQLVFDPDLSKTARRNAMVRFANDTDRSAIEDYRAAREDLEVGSASVRKQLDERKS